MRRGRNGSTQRSPLATCPVLLPTPEVLERSPSPRTVVPDVHPSPGVPRPTTFDVAAAIRTFKLFEAAPQELIDMIMVSMRSRVVEKGDEICREGEDAKAMYWIIRGAVAVVSRDTESKFAELQSGSFFGEIGVLFAMPRTASVIATEKSLLMALTLEHLHQVLPRFPAIERAIREEAQERLELLRKHKRPPAAFVSTSMRDRILAVPMFRHLPDDILHFLALKIKPATFAPFTPILLQDSPGREIYFIVSGSVEVIDAPTSQVRARLGPGQFFGELAWLSLSPLRSASVRSITELESLVLEDSVLQEVSKVYPAMRRSIEQVAQERLSQGHFIMSREIIPPPSEVAAGTLSTIVDQDPYHKQGIKRKLSIPTRASSRISTKQSSAASLSSISPGHRKGRKRSETPQGEVRSSAFAGCLPENVVATILSFMPLTSSVKFRTVHSTWNMLILSMPLPLLSLLNISRMVDDQILTQVALFAGHRAQAIDISHCSHLTDTAFNTLTTYCSATVIAFSLASCWNISPPALIDLAMRAPNLRSLNLSNCRKMNDQALFQIINAAQKLEELDLGYCKNISDRSMHCIAVHASTRLKVLKLARCTSITDAGFGYWSYAPHGFPRLTTLILRDCTFLTDNSIVALTNSCHALQRIDLSFCCALSDTSVEVLALGLPNLKQLLLAFCGSAVSDSSLRSVAHHLQRLKQLSVRGCVRVTDAGVSAILSSIRTLKILDITQCRNIQTHPSRAGLEIRTGG